MGEVGANNYSPLQRFPGGGRGEPCVHPEFSDGLLDRIREKLEFVFEQLVSRHESFRTSFEMVDGHPVQRIHDEVEFAIEFYDQELPTANCQLPTFSDFVRPFDLTRAPLLRVRVVHTGNLEYILMIDMHHIISDGTSQAILEEEFVVLCAAGNLTPMRLQYKDYSEWQNSNRQKEQVKKQERYWLNEFPYNDEVPVLDLPTDYPRPSVQSFAGTSHMFELNGEETKILKDIAEENDVTLYMILLVMFNVLFSKLSGQEDIIIGTPIAARPHHDLQYIIGMLVNTLAMRNYPTGDKPLRRFLKEVKQRTLEAYENQEYPFEELVEKISVNRDTGRNPVFDVMLNLLTQTDSRQGPGISAAKSEDRDVTRHQRVTSRFDLTFSGVDLGERIVFDIEYSTALFKPVTIERFINYLKKIVSALPETIDQTLADIEITAPVEKEQILAMSRGLKEPAAKQPLHRLFEDRVQAVPHRTALVFEGGYLTYRELNQRANRLARLLREKGVGADTVVGVMVERSFHMIIAILAVLKAGGAYLPIDTEYPAERVYSMLEDSKAALLLSKRKTLDRFSITGLKGMKAHKENLFITAGRIQVKDFDALPLPDRGLINYTNYHRYIGEAPAKDSITLQATRGCPYNCAFCHKIWPKNHVTRSAENIFKEISCNCDAGIRRFVFIDDIFNLDRNNMRRLLEKIIKGKMDIQLFFPNGFRADILTEDFIDLMVEAGTVNIDVALESASPRIQKLIRKNLDLEKFEMNVRYIAEKYPRVILEMEMMLGFPTETEEEAVMTLDFLKRLKWVHFPNLHVLKIYPNTDMYRLAIENGIPGESIRRSVDLAFHQLPETLPYSKSFTRQLQAKFMGEYFLSKERLLKVLPDQIKVLTRDELVQKYDSYLPDDISCFDDILKYVGIPGGELNLEIGNIALMQDHHWQAPDYTEKIKKYFPVNQPSAGAFRILLLDLSQLFSHEKETMLHLQIEEPLGLLYLMSYLNEQFKDRICGKVAKSRVDFDSYEELKKLIFDFAPDLIGIRTLSFYKDFFHKAVLLMRQWGVGVPIAAGGPYASSDYQLILQDPLVDLAVLGEGEFTLAELVEKMMQNGYSLPGDETLQEITGIAFVKNRYKSRALKNKKREIVVLDELPHLERYSPGNPENVNQTGDLVYVIYTSGSTGKPKGVMLEHRNLINLIRHQYRFTDIDFTRVLQFTTISFDVSAQEIFSTLLAGGGLVLAGKETINDIPRLLREVARENIKTLFLAASFLKFITNEADYMTMMPGGLGHIITAGEQVIINEAFRVYLQDAGVYFHNHYGPSETHVVTAWTWGPGPGEELPELPPIGKPISNTNIYIVDRGKNLVPVGAAGELMIGGVQIGRGYLNRPGLTAETFCLRRPGGSFCKNRPLDPRKNFLLEGAPESVDILTNDQWPMTNDRLYSTGDLARWLADGNLEFLGRIDQQVKIRGFRVELGEIESQLLNHEYIREAVAVAREDERGLQYLCAYFVSEKELASPELREYLSRSLPGYMIPSYFVMVDKIPLTPNRKIDRKALPEPKLKAGADFTVPRDDIERRLAKVWSEVLSIDGNVIGIDSNFFSLGGHSLTATLLTAKVHKEFQVVLPLVEVFKKPHIRGLSQYIGGLAAEKFTAIEPLEKREYYRLFSAQKRLFFLHRLDPLSTVYNMPEVIPLVRESDCRKLEQTFEQLIDRHESLRTSFEMVKGIPVQKVHDKVEFEIECYDLSTISDFVRPFALTRAPLMRVGVIKIENNNHLLLVDMHHIISDGVSHNILARDFMAIYTGNKPPPLRRQYKDYAEWQNTRLQTGELRQQERFWLRAFADDIPILDLPLDYPRPEVQSFAGDVLSFEIDKEETALLKQIAGRQEATLFMVLLAIYTTFMSKISGQEDIVVGIPTAGRGHADLGEIIGMFVNTLALRNFPRGPKSFSGLLGEVKERTLQAFENQEYPFEELVEKAAVVRDTGRNPLFDVMLALQDMERAGVENVETGHGTDQAPNVGAYEYRNRHRVSKFDITLHCIPGDEMLHFAFEYCTRLFKKETIERFISYFTRIISLVARDPGIKLRQVEIIPGEEKRQILYEFNDTRADYPSDKTIHELFEEQAARSCDGTAVVCIEQGVGAQHAVPLPMDHVSLTYKELNRKSDQLARVLREKGVGPDTVVGIMVERSLEMIMGIIGILKAGGAYMPIDPGYPQDRLDFMMNDSKAKVLLKKSEIRNSNDRNITNGPMVLNFEHLNFEFAADFGFRASNLRPSSLAYIIYTSGTTGRPKGCMIDHRNVVRLMVNDRFQFDFNADDVWTFFHSYCFDFSVWELWGAFVYGGRLIIVPRMTARDPRQFLELLKKERVTVLNQTPGAFYYLIDEALGDTGRLSGPRYVIFGGEALAPARLKGWKEKYPQTTLVNMYGITETTVHVTFKVITDREIRLNQGNIGKPLPTLTVYIMDKYMRLQPPGVAGELCVGGDGTARGYLNRPELTREKFDHDLWDYQDYHDEDQKLLRGVQGGGFLEKSPPGRRRHYKSGDLARWLADGDLEYLGRIDHQVKIRGYRVELGEIENQLAIHKQIREAVVIFRGDDGSDNRLCAYIVPRSAGPVKSVTASQLREYLSLRLPGYMIPAYFIQLEELPLTPNGKLDRAALPPPRPEAAVQYTPPGDDVEAKLVSIWQEVLGLENTPVSTHADFFALGGHSLNAIGVVNAIHKIFNVKLSIQTIFRSPTIVELAAIIRENEITPFIEITSLPPREYYELSYAQKRLWVIQKRNPDSQVFNMPERETFYGKVDKGIIREVLERLIARHESLRTYFTAVDGKIVQRIVPEENVRINVPVIDLSSLPEEQQVQGYRLLAEESIIPFNLEKPPLLRVKLVKYQEDEWDLIFNMHHLISDGWSMEVLRKEFSLLYNALSQGYEYELEPVNIQYKDYAHWHNRLLEDPAKMQGAFEFWKSQLQGTIPRLNLPYDFPPTGITGKKSSGFRAVVDGETTEELRALGKHYNASLFMVLLAGMNMLLYRLRGQEDILIGIPGAARQHEDLKHTIGLFVNTLILRTYIDKEETFPDFLKRIQTDTLKMLEYQSFPLELLCEKLNVKYPQISLFFNMVNTGDSNRRLLTAAQSYHIETVQDAKFDIVFYLLEYKNGIDIVCNYYSRLFMPETIEKIVQMYLKLLQKIAGAPQKQLKEYWKTHKKRKLKRKSITDRLIKDHKDMPTPG
jgi:amino acid adenylation domain-containing protein